MAGLSRLSAILQGRTRRPDATDAEQLTDDQPSSLYLFGPTACLGVGKRFDYATVDPAAGVALRRR